MIRDVTSDKTTLNCILQAYCEYYRNRVCYMTERMGRNAKLHPPDSLEIERILREATRRRVERRKEI
jgi:hypothetical protein